jgi:hypothetical protein
MSVPVVNWSRTSGNVQLFHDLVDPALLHYGPTTTWGAALVKQELGQRFTLLRGEVDFGYSPDGLSALQTQFPKFRLAPLIAEDVVNSAAPSVPIGSPHTLKLSLIPSLPFPKLSFNLTVSHEDPNYQALITQVETKWTEKALFTGNVAFTFAMRRVACAYRASLPTADVAQQLRTALNGAKWSAVQVPQDVSSVVKANKARWIQSAVPTGFPSGCENEVLSFVVAKVISSFFRPTQPLIAFDNGETVEALELVDAATLVPQQRWTLNTSVDSSETIRVLGAE